MSPCSAVSAKVNHVRHKASNAELFLTVQAMPLKMLALLHFAVLYRKYKRASRNICPAETCMSVSCQSIPFMAFVCTGVHFCFTVAYMQM